MPAKGNFEIKSMPQRKYAVDFGACFFLLLLFSFFFAPVLFDEKTFFFRDILSFAYPMKRFIWESFQANALPFWWPQVFCGVPFLALMGPGVFYPLNLFFFMDDFTTSYNLFFLSQHFLLMISVYALTRFWGQSVGASLVSSVTALLGGYFLALSSLHNHFQSAVWFPLVLLFLCKFLNTGKTRHFIFWVLALTAQILAGSPEHCLLTVAVLTGYILVAVPPGTRFNEPKHHLIFLASGVLLALGLAACQLLPTYLLLDESVRAGGVSFDAASTWSLDLRLFATFFTPENQIPLIDQKLHGRGYFIPSVYMGVVPAFFLISGLFLTKNISIRFWIVTFWVGIFFALGRHNPLFEVFFNWIPLFDLFRFPQKFLFLSAFSLVFLSGFGIDQFIESASSGKLRPENFIAMLAGAGGLFFLVGWLAPQNHFLHAGGLLILFGVIGFSVFSGKLRPDLFKGLAVVLAVADLLLKNSLLVPLIDSSFYEQPPELLKKHVETQQKLARLYSGALAGQTIPSREIFPQQANLLYAHLDFRERLYPNLGTIYGIEYADGLIGLELRAPSLWTEILMKSPPDKRRRILERSNVRYWITEEDEISPTLDQPLGLKKIETFQNALPRAFLVAQARQGKEPHLVNTYLDPSFDPRASVLVSEPITLKPNTRFDGAIENISYDPNRVTIQSRLNSEGVLVLLDSYFPGWTVRVDGKENPVFRANHFFRGVRLGPGQHLVEFEFVPQGFQTGVLVSALSLLGLVLAGNLPFFRRGGTQ
ncbi:hypothetical protein UR09_00410 [Candidatus Nitromaritima sp. SCGC AAA799-A02]|nr:hypothetical protein UR09_00410 [Candidatus Nitromaritima sp. SCGC AAA799-A02]